MPGRDRRSRPAPSSVPDLDGRRRLRATRSTCRRRTARSAVGRAALPVAAGRGRRRESVGPAPGRSASRRRRSASAGGAMTAVQRSWPVTSAPPSAESVLTPRGRAARPATTSDGAPRREHGRAGGYGVTWRAWYGTFRVTWLRSLDACGWDLTHDGATGRRRGRGRHGSRTHAAPGRGRSPGRTGRTIVVFLVAIVVLARCSALVPPFVVRAILDTAIPDGDRRADHLARRRSPSSPRSPTPGCRSCSAGASSRVGEGLIYDLRRALFAKVQRMPIAFFTRTPTGALTSPAQQRRRRRPDRRHEHARQRREQRRRAGHDAASRCSPSSGG